MAGESMGWEGGGGGLPHAEMGDVFVVCHSAIPDLEHVEIIPCAGLTLVHY